MGDLRAVELGSGERRWRARYRDAVGRQVVRQFKRRADAQAWIDQATHDRVAGTLSDRRAGRQTLQELYEEVHATRRYAPATVAMHGVAWKHVPAAVRGRAIAAIDSGTVDRVLSAVQAPAMREKLRAILSTMFAQAIAARRITVNPAKRSGRRATRAERAETGPREQGFLTAAELARLVEEIPERYRAMIRLMAHVGLRPGEAYALTAGQLDPLAGVLTVDRSVTGPTKTGETRSVPLPRVVVELVAAHIARFASWDPDAQLFGTIDPHNFRRRVFSRAAKRAGVAGVRPNDLRHSAAAFAIGNGADVYSVQRMLGHAKASITLDTYGHLWDRSGVALAERLDSAIREVWTEPPADRLAAVR